MSEKHRDYFKQIDPVSVSGHSKPSIHDWLFLGFSCLFVTVMPVFGRLLPLIIIGWGLTRLADPKFYAYAGNLVKDPTRYFTLLLALLYLVYLIGMLYTVDLAYGWKDLFLKLNMLIFPFLFATSSKPGIIRRSFETVLLFFITGCLLGIIFFLSRATCSYFIYPYWFHQTESVFIHKQLSWYFHPSYLTMYLNFGILAIAYLIMANRQRYPLGLKGIFIGLMIIFFFFIFLLSSKAGILILILNSLLLTGYFAVVERKWVQGLIIAGLTTLLFLLGFWLVPYVSSRFDNVEKTMAQRNQKLGESSEGTAERLVVWKESWSLIRENPLKGVGTGDIKTELLQKFRDTNATAALGSRLNSHNQYLQTWATIGVFGLILLLATLCIPAWLAFICKNWLYLMFLCNFSLNIIVESMFETQAGVMYYSFFNAILFWYTIHMIPLNDGKKKGHTFA